MTEHTPVHISRSQGITLNRSKPIEPVALPPERRFKKPSLIYGGVALLVVVLISISLYRHMRTASANDVRNLVEEVGKSIELPTETPTVATVTDPNALSTESFFKEAKVGDRVLIFSKAGKAVLYRPAEKKVVAVGPLIK